MVHSEIMLLEIIKLYVQASENDVLELNLLEDAFYTLEEILSNNLGISLDYEFNEELNKLENICNDLISIDEEAITFLNDDCLDLLEDQIILSLEDEDMEFDQCIPEYIYNICIYKNLGINPPIEEYQDILNICFTMIKDYELLGYQEVKMGKANFYLQSLIKAMKEKYQELYADLSHQDVSKIKVILAYLNDLYLLDGDSNFINSAWYIILFSHNLKQFHFLEYERLFHSINEEEEEYGEDDDDFLGEILDIDSQQVSSECSYLDDEISFFLSYYTILLNKSLKELNSSDCLTLLLIKKYLLIAIQPEMEDFYLKNGTIDTLKLPELKQEWLDERSFTSLYLIAAESVNSFNYMDATITSEMYADMIIRAVFIKSFLDLCINKENINDIKMRICNSDFYKNPNYSIATNIIDDIIFRTQDMDLSLK